MMLHFILLTSIIAGLGSGIYVLALGDWRSLQLKYAGVILSTFSMLFVLVLFLQGNTMLQCTQDAGDCTSWHIYQIVRNVAVILFHISVGRDAIIVKKRDRRVDNGKFRSGELVRHL